MRKLLLALILIGAVISAHCKETEISLLAVVGNETISKGDVIRATITPLNEGSDNIFLEISRTVYDESLQKSLRNSYSSAISLAKKEPCSVVITFRNYGGELGGPSGGLTLALGFYEMLTGGDLNLEEFGISGAIDDLGNIYPVGGVLEKTEAALKEGKKAVIIPITDRFDYILLENFFGLDKVFFVTTLEEALEALKGNKVVDATDYLFSFEAPINLSPTTYKYDFEKHYAQLRQDYSKSLDKVIDKLPEKAQNYYSSLLDAADIEDSFGYSYSASNTLFLANAELLAFSSLLNGEDVKEEAEACLRDISLPLPNYENFEFVAGAKFRVLRAKNTIANAEEKGTISSKAYAYRDYAEALEWCKFAKTLSGEARVLSGVELDQSLLKKEVINRLRSYNLGELDGRAREFYLLSLYSAAEGDYLTSLYYTAYLKTEMGEEAEIEDGEFKSFWGKVFASHYEFTKDDSALKLAKNVEEVYRFILSSKELALEKYQSPEPTLRVDFKADDDYLITSLQIIVIMGFLLGVIVWMQHR